MVWTDSGEGMNAFPGVAMRQCGAGSKWALAEADVSADKWRHSIQLSTRTDVYASNIVNSFVSIELNG